MFSILALKIGSEGDKILRKNCLGWRLASFFSRNFVTLVADFEPKLKTWSRQIMFYTNIFAKWVDNSASTIQKVCDLVFLHEMKLKMDQIGLEMYTKKGVKYQVFFLLQSCRFYHSPLLRKISLAEKSWRILRVSTPPFTEKICQSLFENFSRGRRNNCFLKEDVLT